VPPGVWPRLMEIRIDGGVEAVPTFQAIEAWKVPHDPWDDRKRDRWAWFEAAERIGLVPLKTFDVIADRKHVKDSSMAWMWRFLLPEAGPYREGALVERSFHRATATTVDILRHRYEIEVEDGPDRPKVKIALRVFECIDTVLIVVDAIQGKSVLGTPAADRAELLTWIAKRLLLRTGVYVQELGRYAKVEYAWTFLYDSLEEGAWFSTDPTVFPLDMLDFPLRVDGGIRHGRVFFMAYKKYQFKTGRTSFWFDGKHWFDGKSWARYSRQFDPVPEDD
jgi:hypothetical protein